MMLPHAIVSRLLDPPKKIVALDVLLISFVRQKIAMSNETRQSSGLRGILDRGFHMVADLSKVDNVHLENKTMRRCS